VIDIYMPDAKYGDSATAQRYSHVRDYHEVNAAAIREMHRQVGPLVLGEDGLARRGLLVRHLVLPGDLANTEKVLAFIAREVSPDTYVNVMDQYFPCYRAGDDPPLDRPLTREEAARALATARRVGLRRLDRPRR
jgi:putative pyruvate formate lyase activating enzyme